MHKKFHLNVSFYISSFYDFADINGKIGEMTLFSNLIGKGGLEKQVDICPYQLNIFCDTWKMLFSLKKKTVSCFNKVLNGCYRWDNFKKN